MLKGLFETAIKEKKATVLKSKLLKKMFMNYDNYVGIIISDEFFKEFTSRTYFALKHYAKKEKENQEKS